MQSSVRKHFVACAVLLCATAISPAAGQIVSQMLDLDLAHLVERADLTYDKPVERSEAGMPIGNGRMGTLLWTTPTALRMQINRVDVFANNSGSNAFPRRYSDYCGGMGFVDVEFADYGDAVFTNDHTKQHLSCYDGLATVTGKDVQIEALASMEQDVIALRVTDRRERPGTISVNLRTLRDPMVRSANHTARSTLDSNDGKITLTQRFEEDDYYCGSAVAIGVAGRDAQVRQTHDRQWRLVVQPGKSPFVILIASAASFNRDEDPAAVAIRQLEAAKAKGYAELLESNKGWWHDFWTKGFVHLHSDDSVADMIETNYTYYLYIMASSSRGKYPTKFNGMLWTTGGDTRQWGGQYWGANQSCLYNALFATNRLELLDPMFDMYSGMIESCALAARQQWGSQGVYIPEVCTFDGFTRMPDDIATEMRELYLLRKPWEQRSDRFFEYARMKQPHASRWNWKNDGGYEEGLWVPTDKGAGCYGHCTHIHSRGAKIAYQYWLRYEYSMDKNWLRDRAYPILKGVTEFYRNYPNVRKEADGKYHIYHVNSNESIWGGRDTDEEISSMMGLFPVTIKASEILGVDADLRTRWQEFLDNLASLPTSDNPDAPPSRRGGPDGDPHWIRALPPIVRGGGGGRPDGNTMPIWFFDLCTLENDNPETMKLARATYEGYTRRGVNENTRIGVLSKIGVTAAMMGRADHVRYMLPNQLTSPDRAPVMANRLDQREGRQTTSAQRLGRAADTLHNALVQSIPAAPGKLSVIRVFPAWPTDWDAEFTLLCRSGFLVTSAMQKGQIPFVEIHSQVGGECRLRNPWDMEKVTLFRDGKQAENLSGSLLQFDTAGEQNIVIVRAGATPDQLKRTVLK